MRTGGCPHFFGRTPQKWDCPLPARSRQGSCLGRGMTAGAKLLKVWGIKSGVACLEAVVSFLDCQKRRLATALLGLTTHADAQHSGLQAELTLPRCVGPERVVASRLGHARPLRPETDPAFARSCIRHASGRRVGTPAPNARGMAGAYPAPTSSFEGTWHSRRTPRADDHRDRHISVSCLSRSG